MNPSMQAERTVAAQPFLDKILAGELAKQTAAKMLAKARPDLFKTSELARDYFRRVTGAKGEAVSNRPCVQEVYHMTIKEGLERMGAPISNAPVDTSMTGKIGVLSDIHVPYHDYAALEVALQHLAESEVEHILLLGDIVDFQGISRFVRPMGNPSVAQELASLKAFLGLVREMFPGGRIVYLLGNHEERLQAYMYTQMRELADLKELEFENLIEAEKFGVEVVDGMVNLGELIAIHGHEFKNGIAPPVNPARGMFMRAKCSTLSGHQHQPSSHSEGTLKGDRIGNWSLGCLCELSPGYNKFAFTKWDHGFAEVEVSEDGGFSVYNYRIVSGKVRPA